jgi:branched-chain amino acid transport system ATP-binding protein
MLAVTDLRSGYGETEVVHGVSLTLDEGSICALMGKNGAGKSTFLKTVVGLLPIHHGRIEILGEDVTHAPAHRIISRKVTYAPQEQALFADLSVNENLRLGAIGLSKAEFVQATERVISLFPILGRRTKQRAGTLSGGEQGMLRMARALLPEPKLVLLDEISEGIGPAVLDALTAALLYEREVRNATILLVEQNLDFAFGLASRFLMMERGSIVAAASVADPRARDEVTKHLTV